MEDRPASPEKPLENCPRCGAVFLERAIFCEKCGATRPSIGAQFPQHPLPQRPDFRQYQVGRPRSRGASWRVIAKSIVALGCLSLVCFIVVDVFTLIYGVTIVIPELGNTHFPFYLVAPTLITIFRITGFALESYYILLVVAITASVAWLLFKNARGFIQEMSSKGESRKHSAIFDLCTLMFAVTFLNFVIVFFMLLAGYNPTRVIGDAKLWEMLLLLANASVWEELASRVLLIGIPLILIDYFRRRLRPKRLSYILGGGFELGTVETSLLIASSVFFGFAHYEGYGSWKVFPAAVAGAAFGYMFLRHGLAPAIVLHFAFDYLSLPGEVFGMNVTFVTVVLTLLWVGLGFVCFIYFLTRIGEFVTGSKFLEPTSASAEPAWFVQPMSPGRAVHGGQMDNRIGATYAPAQSDARPMEQPRYGEFTGGYVCPMCGHTEARWIDGRFQCLRCGNLL